MAKKIKNEEVVLEEPKQVIQPKKEKITSKDNWEVKDRTYILSGNKEPLTFTIPAKHTRRHPLLWYDSAKGEQRELRYATNMSSPFVDEQKGKVTLGHITFRDGTLSVPKEKIAVALAKGLGKAEAEKILGVKLNMSEEVKEEMTEAQKEKREEIVKELKKKTEDFKKKYGDRWEDVMYATATKMAMKAA